MYVNSELVPSEQMRLQALARCPLCNLVRLGAVLIRLSTGHRQITGHHNLGPMLHRSLKVSLN